MSTGHPRPATAAAHCSGARGPDSRLRTGAACGRGGCPAPAAKALPDRPPLVGLEPTAPHVDHHRPGGGGVFTLGGAGGVPVGGGGGSANAIVVGCSSGSGGCDGHGLTSPREPPGSRRLTVDVVCTRAVARRGAVCDAVFSGARRDPTTGDGLEICSAIGFVAFWIPRLHLGGAPCAVPALCEKSAIFHHR